ncbi:Cd(II)/Pb(II)-responsive transcriptional regulator [Pasteurellaceae bacterium 22721_9_1]
MRIGQLAKTTGCTVETIRFYEKQGLLQPAQRSSNNYRTYTNEHLQRLAFICYCRTLDISLAEIRQLLSLDNATAEQTQEINLLLDRHIKDIAKRIHELDHLRMELIELKRKCLEAEGQNAMSTLLKHSRFVRLK